jgi:hypothetical protein
MSPKEKWEGYIGVNFGRYIVLEKNIAIVPKKLN